MWTTDPCDSSTLTHNLPFFILSVTLFCLIHNHCMCFKENGSELVMVRVIGCFEERTQQMDEPSGTPFLFYMFLWTPRSCFCPAVVSNSEPVKRCVLWDSFWEGVGASNKSFSCTVCHSSMNFSTRPNFVLGVDLCLNGCVLPASTKSCAVYLFIYPR